MKARKTTHNGIEMRSRTEAEFAGYADRCGWTWSYEPECFGSKDGTYLPDFLVTDGIGSFYVEVKPTREMALDALDRMQVIRATYPDACLAVAWPDGWNQEKGRVANWTLVDSTAMDKIMAFMEEEGVATKMQIRQGVGGDGVSSDHAVDMLVERGLLELEDGALQYTLPVEVVEAPA